MSSLPFNRTAARRPAAWLAIGGSRRALKGCSRGDTWRGPKVGFTLLELILVLGILILVASMSSPTLLRAVAGQGLDKGCDMVRSEMARARVRAIRTGKVQALLFAPGGNRMIVQDFDRLVSDPRVMSMSQADFDASTPVMSDDSVLPRNVRFAAADAIANFRSEFETRAAGGQANSSVRPVLFYPDGTSQEARVILVNERGELRQVVLRGLTGTSRVSPLQEGR